MTTSANAKKKLKKSPFAATASSPTAKNKEKGKQRSPSKQTKLEAAANEERIEDAVSDSTTLAKKHQAIEHTAAPGEDGAESRVSASSKEESTQKKHGNEGDADAVPEEKEVATSDAKNDDAKGKDTEKDEEMEDDDDDAVVGRATEEQVEETTVMTDKNPQESINTTSSSSSSAIRGFSTNNHPMPRVIRESSQVLNQDVVRSTRTVNGGIVVGQNVSGRPWKTRVQKRASSLQTSIPLNNLSRSWARKMQQKEQRRLIQQQQAQLSEERRLAKVERRERRLENERRRAENQFKAQQVFAQTLHPERVQQKLRAMSKKQLRQIKKTRLNPQTGVVEYVPAYAK